MDFFIGLDVGSVNTKAVLINSDNNIEFLVCESTQGNPVKAACEVLSEISGFSKRSYNFDKVLAVTGSAREIVGKKLGAKIVKNEITCQAIAALHYHPDAKTVIEIGGQDSKLIILENGMVRDFSMNTVCAAGTGAFLSHQANRLGITIDSFAAMAINSESPTRIEGRCTVFAETDMISAQQSGEKLKDIIYGMCFTLVQNYLRDTGRAKNINPPVIFQGGVARNVAIVKAFESVLNFKLTLADNPEYTGALGAALLLKYNLEHNI